MRKRINGGFCVFGYLVFSPKPFESEHSFCTQRRSCMTFTWPSNLKVITTSGLEFFKVKVWPSTAVSGVRYRQTFPNLTKNCQEHWDVHWRRSRTKLYSPFLSKVQKTVTWLFNGKTVATAKTLKSLISGTVWAVALVFHSHLQLISLSIAFKPQGHDYFRFRDIQRQSFLAGIFWPGFRENWTRNVLTIHWGYA